MTWCLLTEKRLFKKISYVIMLLLLPALMAGMKTGAKDAGIMTVAVATDGAEDSLAGKLAGEIAGEDSLIRFISFKSEEEGLDALRSGEADAAWIIPADFEEMIEEVARKGKLSPVASVVVREDGLALSFIKEVFESRIFPEFIHKVYLNCVEKFTGGDGELIGFAEGSFASQMMQALVFEPEYADGAQTEDEGLLLTPLRGMLAIWLVMNGFAAMMYYLRDVETGSYDMIPLRKRLKYMLGTEGVVLFNAGLIYIVALLVLGAVTSFLWEVLILLLLLVCIAGFTSLIGMAVPKASALGVIVPTLIFLMIVFCPIFVDIKGFEAIRLLMPPYLYLLAVHDRVYALWLACYASCLMGVTVLLKNTVFSLRKA